MNSLFIRLIEQEFVIKIEDNPANRDYIRIVLHDTRNQYSQGGNLLKTKFNVDSLCGVLVECETRLILNRKIR